MLPFIENVSLHFVELLPKEAARFESHAAALAGPVTITFLVTSPSLLCERLPSCAHTAREELPLLVIDDLHAAVLLDPKLADDDVMDAAGGVCPGVGFIVPLEEDREKLGGGRKKAHARLDTRLGSSSVMTPLGSASMLLPQNLILG